MEKPSESSRPKTEVFQQSAKLALLGRGNSDWCDSKNLPKLQAGLEKLKTAEASVDYDPKSYLILNLLNLLRKTPLNATEQKLAYLEIRGAWDQEIERAHEKNATDNYSFKEKGVHNLFWLERGFKLSGLCKRMTLRNGFIHLLDKTGNSILSLPLALKSRTREILESQEKITACIEKRSRHQETLAKENIKGKNKQIKDFTYFQNTDSWMIGDGKSEITATGKDFYNQTHQPKIEVYLEIDPIGTAVWNNKQNSYIWEKPTDQKQKGRKVYFKHGQIYTIFKGKEEPKKEIPQPLVSQAATVPNSAPAKISPGTKSPLKIAGAPSVAPAPAPTPTVAPTPPPAIAEEAEEPEIEIVNPKSQEPSQNETVELPEEILRLLNNKGHISIAILGGRKAGEGDGAGLFDTIKQLVYDPVKNTLLTINYSRDMSYKKEKLNASTKNNPTKSKRVLQELSGEQVPYHLTIGLKEATEILDILIEEITGPITLDLPANYVVALNGEWKLVPKNAVIRDGQTMLDILRFRHGYIVPDGYKVSRSKAPGTDKKGVREIGADDSHGESSSRIARQDRILTSIISALKTTLSGKSKFSIITTYALPTRKIYGIIKPNTNIPISPYDLGTIRALLELGKQFTDEGKKESISLHYTAGEKTQKEFPFQVEKILPPNRYSTQRFAQTEPLRPKNKGEL